MIRPSEILQDISRHSERTLLLGGILMLSAISGAMTFVLIQYCSSDALSSLVDNPSDCAGAGSLHFGRHCFSDYGWAVGLAAQPNPWEANSAVLDPTGVSTVNDYPAAGLVPQQLFAVLGGLLHAPIFGLVAYLLALALAVLTPAVWAARRARGVEKPLVLVALGISAIPAWAVIDRGNSVGFMAPIALLFLVALCRRRWGIVAIAVVLGALLRPQFIVLVVALFAARQWRLGGIAVGGAIASNLAAYLLWPRDFPNTVFQSIRNVLAHGASGSLTDDVHGLANVSFTSVFSIPEHIAGLSPDSSVAEGFLTRSVIGYVVLLVIVATVLVLGRRIPPVMVGIVLLAAGSLFPTLTYHYYLVFALPIAAVIARAPDGPSGSGIFSNPGERRRVVGICVTVAAALSIAYVALPIDAPLALTTRALAPSLWLIACAVIIVSYARRPALQPSNLESLGVVITPPMHADPIAIAVPARSAATALIGPSGAHPFAMDGTREDVREHDQHSGPHDKMRENPPL